MTFRLAGDGFDVVPPKRGDVAVRLALRVPPGWPPLALSLSGGEPERIRSLLMGVCSEGGTVLPPIWRRRDVRVRNAWAPGVAGALAMVLAIMLFSPRRDLGMVISLPGVVGVMLGGFPAVVARGSAREGARAAAALRARAEGGGA